MQELKIVEKITDKLWLSLLVVVVMWIIGTYIPDATSSALAMIWVNAIKMFFALGAFFFLFKGISKAMRRKEGKWREEANKKQKSDSKQVCWYQKIRWWVFLIIAVVSWFFQYNDIVFELIFYFFLIISMIGFIKEDYFDLNKLSTKKRKVLKVLVAAGYLIGFFIIMVVATYLIFWYE